jgi:TolB-like protein/Tfp pilus assembly protein PilF
LWIGLAGASLAALLGVGYFLARTHARPEDVAPRSIKSLAVLPLKNLSGDPAQDYLADGMTEALIGRLAGIHSLRVVSRTSVMRFKNPQSSVPEIAKTLGVDAIVEGSVLREGNRIRVTAQLIRGATDAHIWSETYDREMRDALALESELAQTITEKVSVTVTGDEQKRIATMRPVEPEVYESYLKGRFTLDNSNDKAGVERSLEYFGRAVQRDPTFAPAYVGQAEAYSVLGTIFIGEPPEQSRKAEWTAATTATQLNPDLTEAHLLLAEVEQEKWQWSDAEAEYRRAIALSPNDAEAYGGLSSWMLSQGRLEEALAMAQHSRELDPLAVSGTGMGWILFSARRYDEAIREFRGVLAVQPHDANALWNLGFVLSADNQPEKAIEVLEKALEISHRSPGVIGVLVRAYAQAGRRDDAVRLLAELKNRQKKGYIPAGAFVNAYLGLDDKEQAFHWLDQAYKEQSNLLQFVKTHPFFDPIRSDPRFQDLQRRMGLG